MKRFAYLLIALLLGAGAHAQIPLQQSTASQAVKFGPFVSSTDGNTESTALTIANTDIKCSKNGGTLTSKNAGGGTHDANGWYTVTFDATDTNTAGRLQCFVHVAGALPVFREFMVYPTANYAAIFSTAPGAAGGLFIAGTNAATTITTGLTTTFTGNLTGSVGSVTGAVGSVTGAVGSVTGNVGGNVTGSVGSIASAGISEASFATTAGSFKPLGIIDQGTAQSATSTTLVLRAALAMGDSTANGMVLVACGSTQGYCQSRAITGYVGATDTATVDAWSVTPSGTITYSLFGTAPSTGGGAGLDAAATRAALGLASANLDTQLSTIAGYIDTEVAAVKTKTDFLPSAAAGAAGGVFIAGTNAATSITTGLTANITGNVSGSVGSVTGAVGSVTGAVGSVTGSVGSIATGGITEGSFATTAGSLLALGIVDQGTAQAATATTLQLRAAATFADSTLNGSTIIACGSTQGYCQTNTISTYTGATDTATVPTWAVTPSGTISYYVMGTAASASGAPSAATVAAAVWDLSTTGHTTGGTFGSAMQAAGSAGDPWATSLPGAYAVGTAGNILGNRLDAAISGRMATFTLPTNFSSLSIDGSGRTLLQPTQTGVTIPTVTTLTNMSDLLNLVIEPNGSVTLKCALATDLAYAAGDLTTTSGTSTYKDPSGTANRITGTVSSPGNRLASISCPP